MALVGVFLSALGVIGVGLGCDLDVVASDDLFEAAFDRAKLNWVETIRRLADR